MSHRERMEVPTGGRGFIDLTDDVAAIVARAGVNEAQCHVFVHHTSCSLVVTENADPDVRRDLETIFRRLAPDGDSAYRHDAEGPDDMPAHVRSALTLTSLTVPVLAGRLGLGTWQGLYLWEHRHAAHRRRVTVTVVPL